MLEQDRLTYHLSELLNELKAQIAEEIATSVIASLTSLNSLNSGSQNDKFLTIEEVAELFQISKSHINNLRNEHPEFPLLKIGESVRYKQSELEQFFKTNNKNE